MSLWSISPINSALALGIGSCIFVAQVLILGFYWNGQLGITYGLRVAWRVCTIMAIFFAFWFIWHLVGNPDKPLV